MEKICKVCNKPLKGRRDKKYCDDHCRNTYNNTTKRSPRERKKQRLIRIFNAMDVGDQRQLSWDRLKLLVEKDRSNLSWIMDELKKLIDSECSEILAPFQ